MKVVRSHRMTGFVGRKCRPAHWPGKDEVARLVRDQRKLAR